MNGNTDRDNADTQLEQKIRIDFYEVVQEYVDEIWGKFDENGDNSLDKFEIQQMVQEMVAESSSFGDFSYDEFENLFKSLD